MSFYRPSQVKERLEEIFEGFQHGYASSSGHCRTAISRMRYIDNGCIAEVELPGVRKQNINIKKDFDNSSGFLTISINATRVTFQDAADSNTSEPRKVIEDFVSNLNLQINKAGQNTLTYSYQDGILTLKVIF